MSKHYDIPATTSNRIYVVPFGRGRLPGIFDDWDEANAQVIGFRNNLVRRFPTVELALAYWAKMSPGVEPCFYFIHQA